MGDSEVRAEEGVHAGVPHFDPGTNVLLLSPALEPAGQQACGALSTGLRSPGRDVLVVSFTGTPDDVIQRLRAQATATPPSKIGIISIGDSTRSAAATDGGSPSGPVTISTLSSPGDLTGIGITITEQLREWAGDGNQISICFDSLSMLLQYANVDRTFRFLHVFTGRLRSVDAIAHFHMDPSVHDERTLNTIKTLFDAAVEIDDNGNWRVKRR